ncbi:MAG: 4Fe-4S dicluster domain-containing protein [Bacteroidales bacterium]|nr:MAG: 4Fe-4S dicluster domain-containing protein [Bacteroidales bacterium]
MEKVLLKKDLNSWAGKLGSYDIYAPFKSGDVWGYELMENQAEITLDYPNTAIPPKKILFPQREVLFEFEATQEGGMEIREVLPDDTPKIIFGVRSCDARGLAKLGKISQGGIEDVYFTRRRNQTVIAGLACHNPPSPYCFCTSVGGSPHSLEGMDILMTDLGDAYYLESVTEEGVKLMGSAEGIVTDPDDKQKADKEKIHSDSEKKILLDISDMEKINEALSEIFDTGLWDRESLSCLRCGICTFSCPVCHCFDVNDEIIRTHPLKGKRVRTWDNCQFPDFTMHSSGHNPRSDKASRLRQRVMHKFRYFNENCEEFLCTGCGRCIEKCPVGIDIVEVLEKAKTYEK